MRNQDPQDDLNRFPIRELSVRTKVNTVTIRAWERRYGLLTPQRTSKGHRLYSSEDVVTVEKILSLVARGVPLGKVKPLLNENNFNELSANDSDSWVGSVKQLVEAIQSFSFGRVQHLINAFFLNYPARVCREKLIEPTVERLMQSSDNKAAYLFAESELIRYALFRLNAKTGKDKQVKNDHPSLILICGVNSPIWRLSLMAMELSDAHFQVRLIYGLFNVATWLEMSGKLQESTSIFYRDGVWRKKEGEVVAAALATEHNLMLCGTAGILAGLVDETKVFPDIDNCIEFLLKTSKNK